MHAGEWCLFVVLFNMHIFTVYCLFSCFDPFDVQVLEIVAGDLLDVAKLWRSFLTLVVPMLKMVVISVISFVG